MMASGAEFFTLNEVNRLKVIQDIVDRRLTILFAAESLSFSARHCPCLIQH